MQVWGRGIDLDRFNPGLRRSVGFRRSHGVRDEKGDILIIWVGRLVPEKRPDIWRDVFQRVSDQITGALLEQLTLPHPDKTFAVRTDKNASCKRRVFP